LTITETSVPDVSSYVIMYDVTMPCGRSGSDHVREIAVELRTAALKSLGGSPGANVD